MKILFTFFLLSSSISLAQKNMIAIIDDYSSPTSHGHRVTKSFTEYSGKLKFAPEIIELNINGHRELDLVSLVKIAIDLKVKVINLSFGYTSLGSVEFDMNEYRVLKKASDAGIWIIVASGNDGKELSQTHSVYPCMYKIENLVCVGAEENKKRVNSSNYGSLVYLFANGVSGRENKSSFSAPKVTQAIALFYENTFGRKFSRDYLAYSVVKEAKGEDLIFNLGQFESQIQYDRLVTTTVIKTRGPL